MFYICKLNAVTISYIHNNHINVYVIIFLLFRTIDTQKYVILLQFILKLENLLFNYTCLYVRMFIMTITRHTIKINTQAHTL